MVDLINPIGQAQQTQSVKNTVSKQNEAKDTQKSPSSPVDQIALSEEALNLAQAEKSARDIASQLGGDNSISLSTDIERLNALV
tara:strand:- start:855 stop:1106 length:252 start_codon:yes stop_codon:yes gene_type:complete